MTVSLDSFDRPLQAAIVGGTGGIGAALVRQIAAIDGVSRIVSMSRRAGQHRDPRIESIRLDLTDEISIAKALRHVETLGRFDLVVIASGILHDGGTQPEKSVRDIRYSAMASVLSVNTVGPAVVAAGFLPLMRQDRKSVLAAVSARVGSIGDNRLGGWVSYRASKAALNMVVRTCSIEQARKNRRCAVISVHPGTVATALSEPFIRRIPRDRVFAPDYAATRLLQVIDKVDASDTGGFFAWDGTRIQY